jgi:hypothetical protein
VEYRLEEMLALLEQYAQNVLFILSWSMGVLLCSSAISVAARSSGHPIINRHQHDGFALRSSKAMIVQAIPLLL